EGCNCTEGETQSCGSDEGECVAGTQTCANNQWSDDCDGETGPSDETCDGADNDCDGETDEDLTEACYTGAAGTENVGVCTGGTKNCTSGSWGDCEGETTPASSETCDDGLDNDCDGTVDEDCADSGETPVETSASAIDNCVPSDGSPSTLGSDDFDPALSISDILGLQEGGLITTYAAGQEYTATWNDSTGKVDLKSVATGEMTTCEYLAEAEVGVRAAGGGCLNMGGSAAMPASPVPFIWLIVNLGVLFGFRLRRLFLRHRNSQL
ncbi:MAG: hypothetical protein HYU99_09760, partial [Deltaproteobacteria bacterium]|nr:hypothetical protein [Deltaproteobacteria bacterium]